jgi:hypothetical protein
MRQLKIPTRVEGGFQSPAAVTARRRRMAARLVQPAPAGYVPRPVS